MCTGCALCPPDHQRPPNAAQIRFVYPLEAYWCQKAQKKKPQLSQRGKKTPTFEYPPLSAHPPLPLVQSRCAPCVFPVALSRGYLGVVCGARGSCGVGRWVVESAILAFFLTSTHLLVTGVTSSPCALSRPRTYPRRFLTRPCDPLVNASSWKWKQGF